MTGTKPSHRFQAPGVPAILLFPFLFGCADRPTAPGLEPLEANVVIGGGRATECSIALHECLHNEMHRHRTRSIACNGDPDCLEAERILHHALTKEIRRDYLLCRRALR